MEYASSEPGRDDLVNLTSSYSFSETVQRLTAALEKQGIKIFTIIDQAAEAVSAGLSLPPTTLIIFGNPKAGTPLMVAAPQAGIDLPLKVLVSQEEDSSQVTVTFNTASFIIGRHGLSSDFVKNLSGAEQLVRNAVTAE